MLAQRALSSRVSAPGVDVNRYFDHRAATGRSIEMLVGAELELLWTSAAALALAGRRGPFSFGDDRLRVPQRRLEDGLRAFLVALGEANGVWAMDADGRWLVRAEPVTPADAPPAWMLTWQAMDEDDRYLWADIGAHLNLTPSETRILHSLLNGSTVDETAVQLSITIQTARTHVRRIYAKLGVSSREQLFAVALPYRWG